MVALADQHGRRLDYLRLAVTDRCNLRCRYCMPRPGVDRESLMTLEEAGRLARIFVSLGVKRIRVTGGEPLVRPGVTDLIGRMAGLDPAPEVLLTTNGTLLGAHVEALWQAGVRRVNVSLDSLRPETYLEITGRADLARVRDGLECAAAAGMIIKINVVVLAGINDGEIPDFVALTRDRPWGVRFIEPMPFDDERGAWAAGAAFDGDRIHEAIRRRFTLYPDPLPASAVESRFRIPGHRGTVGIIHGNSRRFCGGCSRLRITARGRLRTCLYGGSVLDLGEQMRQGASDEDIADRVREAVKHRAPDGHVAAAARERHGFGSMASIGG